MRALTRRLATVQSTASTSKKPYNPYRPEVQLPSPPPRKPIVRKLKFGRDGDDEETSSSASSLASSQLSSDVAVSSSSLNLKSHVQGAGGSPSSLIRSRVVSTSSTGGGASSFGDSRNSRYNRTQGGGASATSASLAAWAAGIGLAGAVAYYYVGAPSGKSTGKAAALQAKAMSQEPYSQEELASIIAAFEAPPVDDTSKPMSDRMEVWIKSLQSRICAAIERVEEETCYSPSSPEARRPPGKFFQDSWLRKEGGEGISCVLQQGRVFEKSGVNVSVVYGKLPPKAVESMTADHEGKFKGWYDGKSLLPFKALGISCVMHPYNPHAPTVHFNYRYFEVEDPNNPGQPKAWWFGGGSDLTPSYLYPADAQHFHTSIKSQCTSPAYPYERFKKWCDNYFAIKHRGERRGIGGIFFDDLASTPGDDAGREELFAFVRRCGEDFVHSYVPIVQRRKHALFDERMKQWQQLRRGRYVEFNLVYDRGTQFGLRTPGARIESILMSLPLTARWEYYAKLGSEAGTPEAELLEVLRNPKDWAE